ncbi:methyl-accepting chemotaxis protein [Vibrio sp. MarTm2]|uniref:methyl-accepting chemotaxis protein n=1 Tax=Vibrio sp. MarTm2 TaxID=2998831 RepID=UPI0022CDB5B3|nr:methyl-accepting chemotaxis protein [Vibrio sp. MarTm2]MDA0129095.1 methyl-accepting chemotaxis protein [Vibrio sp. MarTm2]
MAQTSGKRSLSLIQSLSAIFITITLLVVTLSVTTVKGINRVSEQFTVLSDNALPLSMTNAKLTQSILEQVKQLSYSRQVETLGELSDIESTITNLGQESQGYVEDVVATSRDFSQSIETEQLEQLEVNLDLLRSNTNSILDTQRRLLQMQEMIASQVSGFRYGLSSIGPEMNRISSFLTGDNPESADAANRFIASASSMESTFLVLMMQTDLAKALPEYKEMRNRIAGIQLAFDDFAQWHPEVEEFASLTAPYEMVNSGFKDDGVLQQILAKLELMQTQRALNSDVVTSANETILLLNAISNQAEQLVHKSQQDVSTTIDYIAFIVLVSGVGLVVLIVVSWLVLRGWVNLGLRNILKSLSRLTQHDLTQQAERVGPYEMQEIALQLNDVVESTRSSIASVTRNCETLYQTAEISHDAAESSNQSLTIQNQSLASMVETLLELEQSISEITTVTNESYSESKVAAQHSSHGVQAIEQNQQRLKSLEASLNLNDASMEELDSRVKQIREMVDMISGIAENTNLLALNAAIEAARAGEQGRGFAVVADEVRKLASDTSQQTSNIRERMNELVAAAEHSRTAVNHSRQEMSHALESSDLVKVAFEDIETAVNQIRSRVEKVTIATEEQKRATAEVSEAVALVSDQGVKTKLQLESMVESALQVSNIAGQQQTQLHKYRLD